MIMNTPQHTLPINIPNLLNGLGVYSALMNKQETKMQKREIPHRKYANLTAISFFCSFSAPVLQFVCSL